jgi:hypothetical protein
MATIQYETLTRDELRESLNALTLKVLGMTADEFIEEYRARRLNMASPTVSRLASLARILLATERRAS